MGDGHHCWAAAEIALAIHDTFIFERINETESDFVFLQRIPKEWFFAGSSFSINNVFTSVGKINFEVSSKEKEVCLNFSYQENSGENVSWFICLPFKEINIIDGKNQIRNMNCKESEVELEVEPGNIKLKFLV